MNDQQAERMLALLGSIAGSLATIERSLLPEAPNYKRPIADFADFDWDSIGARVVKTDAYGVAQVEHNDQVYTRRAPENKFGEAIWFSRPDGKDADGNNRYVRLITFRKFGEAEPISRKAEALVQQQRPAPAAQDARQGPQAGTGTPQEPQTHKQAGAQQPAPSAAQSSADDDFAALVSATQRPRPPETVQALILARAKKQPKPQNDDGKDRMRMWTALSNLCGNRQEHIRTVLGYFYGPEVSTKALTEGQCKAITEWVNAVKQPDGSYVPDLHTVTEYKAILAQVQPELLAQ